jgi:hypothetical protein
VELAAQWEADAEMEDLWALVAQVWDLVLDRVDEPSSLEAYPSTVAELLAGRIDATTANRFHWGTLSMLVATLLHFMELETKLGLRRSRHDMGLTEDQVDAV